MRNYESNINNPLTSNSNNNSTAEQLMLSPDNPPWNWLLGLLVWFVSVALIVIIPSIALIFYVISKGYPLGDAKQLTELVQNDATAILVNILAVIPAHFLTIAVAWLVVTNFRKYPFFKMLGWQFGYSKSSQIIAMIGGFIGIIIGFFVLAFLLTKVFGEQDNELLKILRSSQTAVYAVAFMATFTAPIVEEVVYRGVLYSSFQKRFGVSAGVTMATVLFALVHVPQYYPNTATIIMICLLSLVLTLIRVKTKNLLPCIILHTMFNGVQCIGLISETLVKQTPDDQSPAFFHLLN